MLDWIIVGAGFSGATAAERLASRYGKRVLVIDRRDHIGGNARDSIRFGIPYHRYGPHIFHTNSRRVWDYLSQFTNWMPYFHRVTAFVDGQFIPVPFNMKSISMCFPRNIADRICEEMISVFSMGTDVPVLKLRAAESRDMRMLGEFIFSKVFSGYAEKQWGIHAEVLKPSVTERVPVRVSVDDRYFKDRYQALPAEGYSALFSRMLDHPNIEIALNTDWKDVRHTHTKTKVLFTGAIDEFFEYGNGYLPYRTVAFREEKWSRVIGPTAQTNFPDSFDFTRLTNMERLVDDRAPTSSVVAEYPSEYVPGKGEPYYPIPSLGAENAHGAYVKIARKLSGQVWFAGRLGDYQYYNMDQACARVLMLVEKELSRVD